MKISFPINTKYLVKSTTNFNKDLKRIFKQGKDISKIKSIVKKLANGEELEEKYKNHKLTNDKYYKECYECHIEPDWLLVYQYSNEGLILVLISTGSHSDLF